MTIGIVLIFFLQACEVPQKTRRPAGNLADIYNPGRATVHPDFLVNHINDSASVLYIRIFPAELLFNQANEQGAFIARLKESFVLRETDMNPDREKGIIDSASVLRTLNRSDMRNSFFSALPLKAKIGKEYMARVDIADLLRGSVSENFLIVDKTSPFSPQNFRVLSAVTGYPSFTNVFTSQEKFRILFNRMGYDSLFVDYYTPDLSLPRPIFSTAPEIPMKTYPDSVWSLPFNDTTAYQLPMRGMYHIRVSPGT